MGSGVGGGVRGAHLDPHAGAARPAAEELLALFAREEAFEDCRVGCKIRGDGGAHRDGTDRMRRQG